MAKSLGELQADVNEDQMLFEIHGLILALHYEARFLKNPGSIDRANTGFDNILARYGAGPARAAPARKRPSSASVSSVSSPSSTSSKISKD